MNDLPNSTSRVRSMLSAAAAAATFGLAANAQAEISRINGAACKVFGDSATPGLKAWDDGVTNTTSGYLDVICPVPRIVPSPVRDVAIIVDTNMGSGPGSGFCLLHSNDYQGTEVALLSSQWFRGFGRPYFGLTAGAAGTYTSQTVVCHLPPNGRVYDIELYQ